MAMVFWWSIVERTVLCMTWMGKCMLLYSSSNHVLDEFCSMTSGKVSLPLVEGKNFLFGGKDIELDCRSTKANFLSGACFGNGAAFSSSIVTNTAPAKKFHPPSFASSSRTIVNHQGKGNDKDQIMDVSPIQETLGSAPVLSEVTNQSLHWTANWCASRSPYGRYQLDPYCLGENPKAERIKHGMATHTLRSLTTS